MINFDEMYKLIEEIRVPDKTIIVNKDQKEELERKLFSMFPYERENITIFGTRWVDHNEIFIFDTPKEGLNVCK